VITFAFLHPVSLLKAKVTSGGIERAAQKKKGKPGLTLAKLLPRGGEATLPSWARVKTMPKAAPEYTSPTPSVSSSMVVIIAIKLSIKMPASIIKTHTAVPLTTGNRPTHTMVTRSAGKSMDFLEPILSDSEDSGTTHIVLIP
jgi:hypothetical protein